MRKVILYIAVSLDGYIADCRGSVDWLNEYNEAEEDNSYSSFIREIDTVIMGYKTYHQIVTELSPNEWAYSGLKSYVITHHNLPSTSEIQFTDKSPIEVVSRLKQKEGRNIWICGGANIVNQLMQADLIDRFHISIIPTLLGNGIRLFETAEKEKKLKLIEVRACNGIVETILERREKEDSESCYEVTFAKR